MDSAFAKENKKAKVEIFNNMMPLTMFADYPTFISLFVRSQFDVHT